MSPIKMALLIRNFRLDGWNAVRIRSSALYVVLELFLLQHFRAVILNLLILKFPAAFLVLDWQRRRSAPSRHTPLFYLTGCFLRTCVGLNIVISTLTRYHHAAVTCLSVLLEDIQSCATYLDGTACPSRSIITWLFIDAMQSSPVTLSRKNFSL